VHLVIVLSAMCCTLFCDATHTHKCSEDDDSAECIQTQFLQTEFKQYPAKERGHSDGFDSPPGGDTEATLKIITEGLDNDVSACLNAVIPLLPLNNTVCESQCGDSFDMGRLGQTRTYMAMASSPNVENICETGFWNGRSAATWLCSNPTANVYSFDLYFPENNVKVLKSFFGGRFTHFEGDSMVTLSEFAEDPNSPFCDIMVADGGHYDPVPWTDINNFAKITAKQPNRNHTLFLDELMADYDNGCCMDVTKAYTKALRLDMLDTNIGFCEEYLPDDAVEGPAQRFPLVGESTMNLTSPIGGFCAMSFAPDYLKSLD